MNLDYVIKDNRFIFAQSIVVGVIVWALVAHGLALVDTISSPEIVATTIYEIAKSGELIESMHQSMRRILLAFFAAMIVGTALGLVMGMRSFWGGVFRPYIAVGLALPPLFAVVFPAMWFGVNMKTMVAAGAITGFPFFARNLYAGINDIDNGLLTMRESFGVSRFRTIRRIILPAVFPEWIAGARYAFALSWKVIIFAEFLLGDTGIGAQIGEQMDLLSMSGVLAWTFLFVAAYIVIEYGVFQQVEARVLSWREDTSMMAGAG